jgi:hypothetical protein
MSLFAGVLLLGEGWRRRILRPGANPGQRFQIVPDFRGRLDILLWMVSGSLKYEVEV